MAGKKLNPKNNKRPGYKIDFKEVTPAEVGSTTPFESIDLKAKSDTSVSKSKAGKSSGVDVNNTVDITGQIYLGPTNRILERIESILETINSSMDMVLGSILPEQGSFALGDKPSGKPEGKDKGDEDPEDKKKKKKPSAIGEIIKDVSGYNTLKKAVDSPKAILEETKEMLTHLHGIPTVLKSLDLATKGSLDFFKKGASAAGKGIGNLFGKKDAGDKGDQLPLFGDKEKSGGVAALAEKLPKILSKSIGPAITEGLTGVVLDILLPGIGVIMAGLAGAILGTKISDKYGTKISDSLEPVYKSLHLLPTNADIEKEAAAQAAKGIANAPYKQTPEYKRAHPVNLDANSSSFDISKKQFQEDKASKSKPTPPPTVIVNPASSNTSDGGAVGRTTTTIPDMQTHMAAGAMNFGS